MKKHIFETKKTKLIARVMLLVLLLASTLTLTACPGWNGEVNRTITFNSHDELLQFVEKYNSKNDGFVYTFVSFDFSEDSGLEVYEYSFDTIWEIKRSLITDEISYAEMYDKDHNKGFGCEFIFHIDEISTQIKCLYGVNDDYNFYQYDEMSIEFIDSYQVNDKWDYEIHNKYFSSSNNIRDEFADLRTFDTNTMSHSRYYDYMYMYQIKIGGKDEIRVQITSKGELEQEKLDEICQLLLDNIVIINTEG